MAGQVPREKVYGNFRQRGAKKPHKNSERYKRRPGMSDEHLAHVRKLPCCVCGKAGRSDPHHLKCAGGRGAGLRSLDRWAVPLCRTHHDDVERAGSRNEQSWFAKHGIENPTWLAQALWASTGDDGGMRAIVLAHMGKIDAAR